MFRNKRPRFTAGSVRCRLGWLVVVVVEVFWVGWWLILTVPAVCAEFAAEMRLIFMGLSRFRHAAWTHFVTPTTDTFFAPEVTQR